MEKVELFYIDTIKYEGGLPKAAFLLADVKQLESSKVAIIGTGAEAYFTYHFLIEKGIDVECFINNDPAMSGKKLCGILVDSFSTIFEKQLYCIVAMSQEKHYNEVIWQLKVNNVKQYAISFISTFHAFSTPVIQKIVIDEMTKILCDGKKIRDIISPTFNVGTNPNLFRDVFELCWTTTWSNKLFEWFFEEYGLSTERNISQEGKNVVLDMLEIGPGKGLFSAVAHDMNPCINIKWLMFDMNESSTKAVKDKYTEYPANMFETYYGMIEEPTYLIKEKFDIIVMTEVLEHFVNNPVATMCKIADMLKPGGNLFLSTPNWGHLPIYRHYEDIPEYTTIETYKDMYIGHTYQYSKNELEKLLDKCNLVIEKYAVSDSNNHNLIVKRK